MANHCSAGYRFVGCVSRTIRVVRETHPTMVSDYNPSAEYLTHNRYYAPGASVTPSSAAFALSTHTMLR